jgi:hypothetical protein
VRFLHAQAVAGLPPATALNVEGEMAGTLEVQNTMSQTLRGVSSYGKPCASLVRIRLGSDEGEQRLRRQHAQVARHGHRPPASRYVAMACAPAESAGCSPTSSLAKAAHRSVARNRVSGKGWMLGYDYGG